jgi:hypothetical protein
MLRPRAGPRQAQREQRDQNDGGRPDHGRSASRQVGPHVESRPKLIDPVAARSALDRAGVDRAQAEWTFFQRGNLSEIPEGRL